MTGISEGLERNSLEYLVMPMISIDEYESKIDDRRVIVVGFFVKDHSPASDLSQFIEKSSLRPLDTDVSPAPTDDGYYLVFVELGRNDHFPKRVIEMTEQVSNLCDIEKWQFMPYGEDGELYDLTEKNLVKHVNLNPDEVEIEKPKAEPAPAPAQVKEPGPQPAAAPAGPNAGQAPAAPVAPTVAAAESIGKFLSNSLVENIEIRGQWLRITDRSQSRVYKISGYKSGEHARMPVFGLNIGSAVLRESLALQNMLGTAYYVDCADQHVTISDGEHHLILVVDA